MMPTITVIVPVYNIAQYLPRCVDSILAQTFTDFEVVLVDDGSTDQSGEICDAYERKDSRVHVIHKENGGVSAARNTALDAATGKYIAFCDGDDYWEATLLEEAFQKIEMRRADWVSFRYRMVGDSGEIKVYEHPSIDRTFHTPGEKMTFLTESFLRGIVGWAVWARLFRRDTIERYHIRFCESCNNYAEDMGFCAKFLLCTDGVVSIDRCLYNYYQRSDSMMARSQTVIKLHELNEVSYDICTFSQKILPSEVYERFAGVLHYYVMNNQYARLRDCRSNRILRDEFAKIERADWFRGNTKATIRSARRLKGIEGKNPARLIVLFSWGALRRNWTVYLLACWFSSLRHRNKARQS